MNSKIVEAHEYVVKAREALRRGDPTVRAAIGRAGCPACSGDGGCVAGACRI